MIRSLENLWRRLKAWRRAKSSDDGHGEDFFRLKGRVEVVYPNGDVHLVGDNLITDITRVNIVRILAMTSSAAVRSSVTFTDDEGVLLSTSGAVPYLPSKLALGTGTTPSTRAMTGIETAIDGAEYNLSRVSVFDSAAGYGSSDIHIAWEFDVPTGSLNGDDPSDVVTFTEWCLLSSTDELQARKLAEFPKYPDLSFTVRWTWYA